MQERFERLINRLTGVNRLQNLEQQTTRMSLRLEFVEKALGELVVAHKTLS